MAELNNELIEKAKQAKSAEEILALAKENGVSMTEEQAKTAYAKFHPVSGEMSDDELENVAGGGCGQEQDPNKIHEGDRVYCKNHKCVNCGSHYGTIHYGGVGTFTCYYVVTCDCGRMIETDSAYLEDDNLQKA